MTLREKVVVSAYTGIVMCDMAEIHQYINEIMQRPVFTHELAQDDILNEIRKRAEPEFIRICES